jgi:hypothetical protein
MFCKAISTWRRSCANVVQTSQGKRLPLVAKSAVPLTVLSNSYLALPLTATPLGGFEPRRPRH